MPRITNFSSVQSGEDIHKVAHKILDEKLFLTSSRGLHNHPNANNWCPWHYWISPLDPRESGIPKWNYD
jgi:hypothetical protein